MSGVSLECACASPRGFATGVIEVCQQLRQHRFSITLGRMHLCGRLSPGISAEVFRPLRGSTASEAALMGLSASRHRLLQRMPLRSTSNRIAPTTSRVNETYVPYYVAEPCFHGDETCAGSGTWPKERVPGGYRRRWPASALWAFGESAASASGSGELSAQQI